MVRKKLIRLPLTLMGVVLGSIGFMGSTLAAQLDAAAIERGKAASATCVACH